MHKAKHNFTFSKFFGASEVRETCPLYRGLSNLRESRLLTHRNKIVQHRICRRLDSLRYTGRRPGFFSANNLSPIVITLLLVVSVASVFAAPKRPNFSGNWELDAAKSQMRPTKWNSLAL